MKDIVKKVAQIAVGVAVGNVTSSTVDKVVIIVKKVVESRKTES